MNDLIRTQPESTRREDDALGQEDAGGLSETARIEFAIVDGRPRHITESRTQLRGAKCPACLEPVTPRKGAIRSHHFAHAKKQVACEMDGVDVQARVKARMQMLDWLWANNSMRVYESFSCGCVRSDGDHSRHWGLTWDDARIDPNQLAAVATPIVLLAQGEAVAQLFITDSSTDVLAGSAVLAQARIAVEQTLASLNTSEAFPISHIDETCPLCSLPKDVWPGPGGASSPNARRVSRSVVLASRLHTISADGFKHQVRLELHETLDDIDVPVSRALVIGDSRMVWAAIPMDKVLPDPKASFEDLVSRADEWVRRVEQNCLTVDNAEGWIRAPDCDEYGLWGNAERRRRVHEAIALKSEHPDVYEAFEVLGCSPWTVEREVSSAHRKAVQQCHPDRMVQATDEERALANDETAKINVARRLIREHRLR